MTGRPGQAPHTDQAPHADQAGSKQPTREIAQAAAEAAAELAPVLAEVTRRLGTEGGLCEPAYGDAWLANGGRSAS